MGRKTDVSAMLDSCLWAMLPFTLCQMPAYATQVVDVSGEDIDLTVFKSPLAPDSKRPWGFVVGKSSAVLFKRRANDPLQAAALACKEILSGYLPIDFSPDRLSGWNWHDRETRSWWTSCGVVTIHNLPLPQECSPDLQPLKMTVFSKDRVPVYPYQSTFSKRWSSVAWGERSAMAGASIAMKEMDQD